MKQKLLNSFKLKATLLVALLCAVCTGAWAADTTISWSITGVKTTATGGTNVNTELTATPTGGSGTWTAVASTSYAGSNKGAQFGSGSYTFAGTITLSASSIPSTATIKAINITLSSAGTAYKIDASVDGNAFGSQVSVNQKDSKTYSFSDSKVGNNIVLTFSSGGKKNVIITGISVTYEAPSAYTITPTTNDSDMGTAAVSGTTITATPKSGYRVKADDAGYTVTIGTATVSHEGNSNTLTVTPESNCTVQVNFEAIPTYAVTINTPSNGTLEVKNGEDVVTSGQSFVAGTVLTITATPADGYNFKNWQAVDASTHTYTASNTGSYTMTENAVAFSATFTAKVYHKAIFSINGNTENQSNVEEGQAITFPSNPAAIEGKEFMGWVEAPIATVLEEAPEFVNTATQTMGEEDKTYYAVFADRTPGSSTTKTDNLTTSTFGSPGSYGNWSNKQATDGSNAVYAGNTTTYSSKAIQMRDNNSSGIVTTTSGGKAKKVTVTWNSYTSSGRTLQIFGKNTAYAASSDLYDNDKKGTLIGTIVKGTSTELIIEGSYDYIGMRSSSGAMYIDQISVDWQTGTPDEISGYCTTVAADTREAVNITSFTAVNTTLIVGNTTATTVENDQAGWTAAYTYSSDNTDVATVAADGVITAVAKGTANITVTLNVNKSDPDYKKGETFSKSIEITVNNPSHTVTFMANGIEVSSESVEEGEAITVPGDPAAEGAFSFVGWTTATVATPQNAAPELATITTMGDADVTYNAVYAVEVQQKVTATFDASNISNLTSAGTRTWQDNTTGITLKISAGQRYTGTPQTWTVTASSSNDNCMKIYRSGYYIKKVVVTVSDAQYAVGDYYAYEKTDDETGTDLTSDVSTDGPISTWTLDGDYELVALWSTTSNQIRATKVVVDAVIPSTGYYCTAIPTYSVTVGAAGYATFSSDIPLNFTDGDVKAYIAKANGRKGVTFEQVKKVPANTGVLLYSASGATTEVIPVLAGATDDTEGNVFVAVLEDINSLASDDGGNLHNYILHDGSQGLGFYKAAGKKVAAGKAYIQIDYSKVPAASVKGFIALPGFEDETAVSAVKVAAEDGVIYNLAGQRVNKAQRSAQGDASYLKKGIFIVNGKKVVK